MEKIIGKWFSPPLPPHFSSLERHSVLTSLAVPNGNSSWVPMVPQSFLLSLTTAGMQMKDVVHHDKKMARSHIICQEIYGYDGCVIDFDDVTLAEACGARVIYRDDEPAARDVPWAGIPRKKISGP